MIRKTKKDGAALVYVIVVIVLVSVLSAVIVRMTSSSTAGYILANSINQSRYIAEAGVHYAAGQTESDLELLRSGGPATFNLGSDGAFTLTIGAKGSMVPEKYPVRSVSVVNPASAMEARYDLFAEVSPKTTSGP